MGRYDAFEHRFPFHRIDVNWFTLHVDSAMLDKSKDKQRAQFIQKVSIKNLAVEFCSLDSWAELNGDQTNLTKFLRAVCPFLEDEEKSDNQFLKLPKDEKFQDLSVFDLKVLGIILCHGSDEEKLFELYSLIQQNSETISWVDKELKRALISIFKLSTEAMFEQETIFSGLPRPEELSPQHVKSQKENEEELIGEILDGLFDVESVLSKKDFVDKV